MWNYLAAMGLGALAAAIGTPTGVSGGLLLLPILLTGYGLPGSVASATTLLFNIVSTPAGVARHVRQRSLDRRLAALLAAPAVPAAIAGAMVNVFLLGDSGMFRVLVAALLVATAASMLLPRPGRRRPAPDHLPTRARVALAVTGAASGLLGGFYGLGGAVLAAPAALLLTARSVARVSGAALATTLIVSIAGLATYATLDLAGHTSVDTPHWSLGLAFGAGGLIGAYLAARFAPRVPDRVLRTGLAVLVVLGAARLVAP